MTGAFRCRYKMPIFARHKSEVRCGSSRVEQRQLRVGCGWRLHVIGGASGEDGGDVLLAGHAHRCRVSSGADVTDDHVVLLLNARPHPFAESSERCDPVGPRWLPLGARATSSRVRSISTTCRCRHGFALAGVDDRNPVCSRLSPARIVDLSAFRDRPPREGRSGADVIGPCPAVLVDDRLSRLSHRGATMTPAVSLTANIATRGPVIKNPGPLSRRARCDHYAWHHTLS